MTATYPVPPNPWAADYWIELTQSTIWRVGPWGRCILDAGDDAWPEGKLAVPYCDEMQAEGLTIYAELLPLHMTAVPVAAAYPEWAASRSPGAAWSFHGGAPAIPGGGGGGGFVEVPGIPGREVIETPPIAPIPLPAAGLLLICAVVALRIVRMKRC